MCVGRLSIATTDSASFSASSSDLFSVASNDANASFGNGTFGASRIARRKSVSAVPDSPRFW